MREGFLEQESRRANQAKRKMFTILPIVYICLIAFILFATRGDIDLSNYTDKKLLVCLIVFTVLMLIATIYGLGSSIRPAVKGKNLLLPFKENTKEEVGKIIDREAAEGKIQVEEYIGTFSAGKKPHGDRIVLLPSYLLLCSGIGKVTAIPRDKIYWTCAQVGRKGSSSFVVRLLVFTEKRTFYLEGTDVTHVEGIAERLYQYIPNVFSEYNPFILSYELEKLFDKNREEFLRLYESEKQKMHGE